jgi:hypothetical protein
LILYSSRQAVITPLSLMSMLTMIFSCWECPLQKVPHCSLCRTVLQRFVDITSMFFTLNPFLVLLNRMLGNLVLSLPLATILVALLLVLQMTR